MKVISIDYESHLIGPEMIIPKPVCLSWAYDEFNTGLEIGFDQMEACLEKLLKDKSTIKVAHNATFELLVTYEWFPKLRPLLWENLEEGLIYCTQLKQQLIDNISKKPLSSLSLASLVDHYFKIDLSDTKHGDDAWRMRYSELEGVELKDWPEAAINYAIMDSVYAMDVYKKQEKKHSSISQVEHLKASAALNLMSARGMMVCKEKVETLEREIDETLKPAYDILISRGYLTFNEKTGKHSKAMKKLRQHIESNFKSASKSAKGTIETSSSSLERYLIEKPDDEVLLQFRFISQYEKVKSAFISRLKTADPYIYTSYNAIVRSGRTSSRTSSHYPSVNIQQMPRGL